MPVSHMVLGRGVKDRDVRELAVVVGGGRGAPPFGLSCRFVAACFAIRWAIAECVVTLVIGLGPRGVEVPVAGRWWCCSGSSGRLLAVGL